MCKKCQEELLAVLWMIASIVAYEHSFAVAVVAGIIAALHGVAAVLIITLPDIDKYI